MSRRMRSLPAFRQYVDASLADRGDGDDVELDIARERFTARVSTRAVFDPAGERLR